MDSDTSIKYPRESMKFYLIFFSNFSQVHIDLLRHCYGVILAINEIYDEEYRERPVTIWQGGSDITEEVERNLRKGNFYLLS